MRGKCVKLVPQFAQTGVLALFCSSKNTHLIFFFSSSAPKKASVLGSVCALLLLLREPACQGDEVTGRCLHRASPSPGCVRLRAWGRKHGVWIRGYGCFYIFIFMIPLVVSGLYRSGNHQSSRHSCSFGNRETGPDRQSNKTSSGRKVTNKKIITLFSFWELLNSKDIYHAPSFVVPFLSQKQA